MVKNLFVFIFTTLFIISFNSSSIAEDNLDIGKTVDYDNIRFSEKDWVRTLPTSKLRKVDYGTYNKKELEIIIHPGNERMDDTKLIETIEAVTLRMPNMKTSENLTSLIYETFVTESNLGLADLKTTAFSRGDYGHAQFRLETVNHILWWLNIVRPDVYDAVMKLYIPEHDLTWNVMYNVPFQIALMTQWYWNRVPDLNKNIGTLECRAKLWKVEYNGKGRGTVNAYLERVEAAYKRIKA